VQLNSIKKMECGPLNKSRLDVTFSEPTYVC
jgi:hypothetical protein